MNIKVIKFVTALLLFLPSYVVNASSHDKWNVVVEIDEFTDKKNTFAEVQGEHGGFISMGCWGGESFEYKVSAGKYIGDKRLYVDNMKYRIDKDEPVSMKMLPTDKRLMYSNDENSQFIYDLMSGSYSVVVELTSYDFSKSRARFSLKDSTKAIQTVLDACK